MAVVVEEDPLLLGIAAQGRAQLLHFVHGWVEALLVPGLLWDKRWGNSPWIQGNTRVHAPFLTLRALNSCVTLDK